jgi:glucose/arabinose dehydrogenase
MKYVKEGEDMHKIKLLTLLLLLASLTGCGTVVPQKYGQSAAPAAPDSGQVLPASQAGTGSPVPRAVSIKIAEAYPNLFFSQPLEYLHAGDNSGRVFVVEKTGRIKVFQNDPQVQAAGVFLDLSGIVDSSASEKGLLGLAFHPDYEKNGLFYVNYTDWSGTVIARYQSDPADPSRGLPDSGTVLMSFPQPYANHNGGHLAFGPDGFLYIAVGDGGSAGDPQGNAQNRGSIYGKMLRIDVDKPGGGKSYGIPADNPFAGNNEGFLEEIYAYGLRNPWKFSFDQKSGWLWTADVGQNRVEEIDIIQKGANYGWNIMEGSLCYPSTANCDRSGLALPVWEYRHPTGNSVTGGYVYYGSKIPGLYGAYVYGDFVSGMIWALWLDSAGADNRILLDTNLNISSFGMDQENELYVVDYRGKIYKVIE